MDVHMSDSTFHHPVHELPNPHPADMFKYSAQPWVKVDPPRHVINPLSTTSLAAAQPPTGLSPTPELDEGRDEAASLSGILSGGRQAPRCPPGGEGEGAGGVQLRSPKGKGVFAKDKRKLREKRRSTGVADIGEMPDDVEHNDADIVTSSNEASSRHIPPQTDVSTHAHIDRHAHLPADHDVTSSDVTGDLSFSPNLMDKENGLNGLCKTRRQSGELPKSCIKSPGTGTKPTVAHKPSEFDRHHPAVGCEGGKEGYYEGGKGGEGVNLSTVNELMKRVELLKKELEGERKKNAALTAQLIDRDSRISELTTEVAALNQDLDLADEDYERLDAENKAILRVVSQCTEVTPLEGSEN